jgi:hypothetical protein
MIFSFSGLCWWALDGIFEKRPGLLRMVRLWAGIYG